MSELPKDDLKVGETEDLATLAKLDETILHNELKARFENKQIYTYVGDILVALNPYEDLGLYTKKYVDRYKNSSRRNNPPHIFAVSDIMYQAMIGRHGHVVDHQCALISGESGAGKTESTKLLIQQIMELVHGNVQLEQQILQVNPLLEAFGNAQTVMNNNSSRFGKYILLKFHKGKVIGAKISEYLLEKSRFTSQGKGEKNFHIYYYMFAGLNDEEKQRYQIKQPSDYKYICDGGADFSKKQEQYKRDFDELMNAIDMVGFSDEDQENMFKILSSALTLGNVRIGEDEEGNATIEGVEQLKIMTTLSGMNVEELTEVLLRNSTTTRGETIIKKYKPLQTEDARDALAKTMYGRLFSWIVNKINSLLVQTDNFHTADLQHIGILDIFGFEHLENNSFEQACINLANEQLQFFFNKHIFKLEQEEYKKEGVNWNEIKFQDNQPLLNLFLERPVGLLALLDEECFFPNGSDLSLVNKMDDTFRGRTHYVIKKGSNTLFSINHYAGKVDYTANGWLEKNRDTLVPGIMSALKDSENPLLRMIFKAKISRTGTLAIQGRITIGRKSTIDAAKRAAQVRADKLTVGTQFKNSLGVLMEQMGAAVPVFIRCIKPNNLKKPKLYEDKYVKSQLLYTGMLETTKIRREGYAVRPSFQEFVEKYQVLALNTSMPHTPASCEKLLKHSGLQGYQIGKSKVFLKYWHLDQLAEASVKLAKTIILVQKGIRGFLARKRVHRLRIVAEQEKKQVENFLQEIQTIQTTFFNNQMKCVEFDKEEQLRKEREALIEKERKEREIQEMERQKREEMERQKREREEREQQEIAAKEELARKEEERRKAEELFPPPPPPIFDEEQTAQSIVVTEDFVEGEIIEDEPKKRPSRNLNNINRAQTVKWFQETQRRKFNSTNSAIFAPWFHGIISRRESERLLNSKPVGCFLIRVSESRFGYSLSFRTANRSRHYMIEQTPNGKYVIIGEPRVHRTLEDMISYHQDYRLCNWEGLLTIPCGQEDGQCDYAELLDDSIYLYPVSSPAYANTKIYPNLNPHHQVPPSLPPSRGTETSRPQGHRHRRH